MSTVVLFVTIIALVAVFAVFFVCYQAQQRERESEAANQAAFDLPSAAVIYTRRSYPTPVTRPIQYHHRYTRKAPTPYTVICNLPCYKYDASQAQAYADDKKEKPQCVICCCDYEQDDKVKILPCLHKYHEECIDAWLKRDHICPICQADVVLAAGLSMHDWSAHTLESVNIVSGSTSPPPAIPPPAAASPLSHRTAAPATANTRHAIDRPATAPAATRGTSSSSSSSMSANSTDAASHAVSLEHVIRGAEALAAAIAALPSSSQQQQQQVLTGQQHPQQWQQDQHHAAEAPQGRLLMNNNRNMLSTTAAAARSDGEVQDATGHRGRDNSSSSTDGNCFVCVEDRPGAIGAGDGDCPSAAHVAVTIHPVAAAAAAAGVVSK